MSTARKPRASRGRTQKAMAVRIDLDLIPYLESQPNKAMAINKAIRAAAQAWQKKQTNLFADTPPDERPSCRTCPHWQDADEGPRCEYIDAPPCEC